MKPKIFFMGEVFDMSNLSTDELEQKLQAKINTYGFQEPCLVKAWEGEFIDDEYNLNIAVRRAYGVGQWIYLRLDDKGYMLEGDADIITGNGHGYTVGKPWRVSDFLREYSGQYSIDRVIFNDTYEDCCKRACANVPEDTELVLYPDGVFQWIMTYSLS